MAAQFHSLRRLDLPNRGTIGDVYYCTDTGEMFLCVGTGGMTPISGLLSGNTSQGPKGDTGDTGPQGPGGSNLTQVAYAVDVTTGGVVTTSGTGVIEATRLKAGSVVDMGTY